VSESQEGSLETEPATPTPEGDATDPTEPTEPTEPARSSRTLVRALAVLTIVSFVGAIAMAVVAARLASQLDEERSERQAATRVASRFAEVFLTYDYEHLDRTKRAVLALSTGKFRRVYEQSVGALDPLFQTTRSRASVVVKDVFTGQIESATVSVVVVADQAVEGISGTKRRLDAWLQLDLVKVGSRWRVDGVSSLNFGGSPGTPSPDVAPTTTEPPTTEPQANG
jgi:hypothetical protein